MNGLSNRPLDYEDMRFLFGKLGGMGRFSADYALLKPPPKRKPPRQAGVREEDARLANDPPPPIVQATSKSFELEDS